MIANTSTKSQSTASWSTVIFFVARIRPDRRTGQFQAIQRTLARPGGGDIRRLGEHRHERSVAERVAIIQVFVAESTYTRRRSSAATGCVTRVGSR